MGTSTTAARPPRAHRGLSTARAALRTITLLAAQPDGVRAEHVAHELAKSTSTAYNLLASLCDEGVAERGAGGRYRLSPAFQRLVGAASVGPPPPPPLAGVVEELLARTHKRAYLGVVHQGRVRVLVERGVQGMPHAPGTEADIADNAHALAIGKVVLARMGRAELEHYLADGLRRFTPATIVDPAALLAELQDVRRTGIARDVEEFAPDFCCIAAPVLSRDRRFAGALGISMTPRAFHDEHEHLEETVREVAFQASAQIGGVLVAPSRPDLASPPGHILRSSPAAPAMGAGAGH